MSNFLDQARDRVLLCDGATGSRVQALNLDVERDYLGQENCTEILNRSRPDLVRELHTGYLRAGADVLLTNSFGGSPITLGEFDLAADAFALNKRAGELAREAIAEFSDGRERFVLGDIGPGTRLPSLGHVDYDTLEAALAEQSRGLLAGGVDGILIETCQDTLQIKAAVNAAKLARKAAGKPDLPILVQVTVETTGTLLVGPDIAAAATVAHALDVPVLGLNCATGPQEMAEHVKWLGENWPGLISVQPNAGLPELVEGRTRYPLQPEEMAKWLERFVREDGVNLIGGCCGTTETHIAALDAMLKRLGGERSRPTPVQRQYHWVPSVASLYAQVPFRQENAYLSIGERCNANGSKKFRELQAAGDWDGCVAIGREQVKEGSHTLDICTAFVGRDEVAEMTEVVKRIRGSVNAPLVLDSTEYPVLEAAMKLYGGKPILNSINFEDGEAPADKRLALAKKFGAAVIALTIDEAGMAKEADAKIRIAKRLYDVAVNRHGLAPEDLLFDPLTFTICTGNADDRKLGLWTLDAIERIAQELPRCQIILGLSNISFGLNPAARHVLNSVYLDHALKRGLTGAIVHISKIMPLHKIAPEEVRVAEDLIFDRRAEGYDPLQAFIALFEQRTAGPKPVKQRAETVEERLKQRIIDGDRQGLELELDEAMVRHAPLDIINVHLLDGMKVVGELFGAGKMQLPFVLQSAETMKSAVAYLEPHMERVEGQQKGTIVLATVKGDVHDIGKNLVDIILTNNGYKVVNLGIKQPLANILQAANENNAQAIGMSGLLVKSTVVMRENLEEMTRAGLDIPVLLGGAALTRRYVEEDCVKVYASGRVAYAKDAFDGLHLMDKVVNGKFDGHLAETARKRAERPSSRKRIGQVSEGRIERPLDLEEIRLRRGELAAGVAVPVPPFWGPRLIERVDVRALLPFLNETMLYQFQWGFRKQGKSRSEFRAWAEQEVRPILRRMVETCIQQDILQPRAAYGYWKAAADGNDLILFGEDGRREVARFALPRQAKEDGLCVADFFRDVSAPERDVIGLQVVTIGQQASETARAWFQENRYQDYLYLHGLSVEMAEAMAEFVHKRIRAELGFGHEDDRDMETMLKQGYRGSRYSFGYPACPRLEDQAPLFKLLGAERIGVALSEEFQIHPEQSTSAIVVHHPQAKYFSV
jgi:5-methyltetrahydrofolate--homocysteine methyltransferase